MCARIKHILSLGTLLDDAIFDAWHSKIFVKRLGLKIRSQLLFSTRFFYLSLVAGNAFKRQISVSGDLLLWLRIAFGGSFLFLIRKKRLTEVIINGTIHSL